MAYRTDSGLSTMFAGCDSAERGERFANYKTALDDSVSKGRSGRYAFARKAGIIDEGSQRSLTKFMERLHSEEILKSVSPEVATQLQADLDGARAALADITKDWTTSNPDSGGLVPYDLQAGIKQLIPLTTPLRNTTSRSQQGLGLATHWKRLTSISGSGVGGATGNALSPFFNSESSTNTFGSLSLRRPAKISYASDTGQSSYVEYGLSDLVTDKSYYAGIGFENVDQLSLHSLTWATLMAEERAILYGRGGSGNGYIGAVSAPVISAADSGASGGLAASAYKIIVLARSGWGTTVQSNEVTVTPTVNHGITVTVTTEPTGALNYDLYVTAAAGGAGTETFQTNFVGNTVTFTSVATGAALPANSDTTADANGFDGWLTVLASQAGYVKRVNGKLSTSNPGTEFQSAFFNLFNLNRSNVDDIWCDSNVMVELGDLLKSASSAPYRIALSNEGGTHGVLGTMVTGVLNQITNKMVDFTVHPFMPTGAVMLRQLHMPFPAENITETAEMRMVQDYMAIDWPKIQLTRDRSTYLFGTMVHYAPAWSGLLLGVQ